MHAIRPWLYIGTRWDVRNPTLLHSQGITATLQLATTVEHYGVVSHSLRIEDAGPLSPVVLREGVDFVLNEKARGATVLISCSGGFSRSVAVAAAVLSEAEGMRLSEALAEITKQHPEAAPHPLLWRSLCDYYQEADPQRPGSRPGRRGARKPTRLREEE